MRQISVVVVVVVVAGQCFDCCVCVCVFLFVLFDAQTHFEVRASVNHRARD